MRETSKEIADRVSDRYPIAPAAVNSQYLVDHMVSFRAASLTTL